MFLSVSGIEGIQKGMRTRAKQGLVLKTMGKSSLHTELHPLSKPLIASVGMVLGVHRSIKLLVDISEITLKAILMQW